jgi:drug/metabolite transporter (DMT)-like permease
MRLPGRVKGVQAALASAIFLGLAPIFGKQAILAGFSPLAVVALRTGIAIILLVALMAIFQRPFFYIYPVGLIGCLLAGFINGLGSIMYYTGLSLVDASVGQLLYSFYPLFFVLWLLVDRQPIQRITLYRLLLAIPGVILLISTGSRPVDPLGALMMVGSAIFYALHLLINQRVLYEVPAPTVTLYTLLSMSATVLVAFLLFDRNLPSAGTSFLPVLGLAGITFFSRITLFLGVKHLGGMQTALMGLAELLVTVFSAALWLGETLTTMQWIGGVMLAASLVLVGFDRYTPEKRHTTGLLSWLNPPKVQPTDIPWQS